MMVAAIWILLSSTIPNWTLGPCCLLWWPLDAAMPVWLSLTSPCDAYCEWLPIKDSFNTGAMLQCMIRRLIVECTPPVSHWSDSVILDSWVLLLIWHSFFISCEILVDLVTLQLWKSQMNLNISLISCSYFFQQAVILHALEWIFSAESMFMQRHAYYRFSVNNDPLGLAIGTLSQSFNQIVNSFFVCDFSRIGWNALEVRMHISVYHISLLPGWSTPIFMPK